MELNVTLCSVAKSYETSFNVDPTILRTNRRPVFGASQHSDDSIRYKDPL